MYLSRANLPFSFKKNIKKFKTSIDHIFLPEALQKFCKAKKTYHESIEDVELLRALEIGLKIKSLKLKGDSFSVDVYDDYKKANLKMSRDKFLKFINNETSIQNRWSSP